MTTGRNDSQENHALRSARGRLLILAATVLWSTSGLFAKAPVFDDWTPQNRGLLFAFWRTAFAAMLLLPFVRRPCWRPALVPMTLAFAAMNVTFLSAMALTTAANAIWLQYTAPVWVFLWGAVVLRDRISGRDWAMLALASIGVATILAFEFSQAAGSGDLGLPGVGLGLISGFCFACVIVSLRGLRNEDGAWLVALSHLVTAVVLLPFVVSAGEWPSGEQWPYLVGFGALQMGIPYLLFARGVRTVAGHEAATIGLLEPVLVPVWVVVAWGKFPAWWTLVGAAFILCGVLARYAPRRP